MPGLPIVLVTHDAARPVRAAYAEILDGHARLHYSGDLPPDALAGVVREACVISSLFPDRELPPELRRQAGHLELLQLITVGSNHVDIKAWPRGLAIGTSPGAQSEEIAEHSLALMLAGAKNLFDRHIKLGRGEFDQFTDNRRLQGRDCAIVGLGGVGRSTARLCRAFGMRVHAINRSGTTVEPVDSIGTLADLDRQLSLADFVVLCVELNDETRHLLNARTLALLKSDAVLVNVARAHLIDEEALYNHLVDNPHFIACLDAWWKEPSTHGAFSTDHPLLQLPNVIGSPHNASRVPGIATKMSRQAALGIRQFLRELGQGTLPPPA